jgi:hypothetical protein
MLGDGGMVQLHGLQEPLVDAFAAGQDGLDGRFADQMRQRNDVAAGARVEVIGQGKEAAGLVRGEFRGSPDLPPRLSADNVHYVK